MIKQLFMSVFLLVQHCSAQSWVNVTNDYIQNPSFEEFTACPPGFSDPTNYWIDSCVGWSHATYASPDLLTACSASLNPLFGIPYNYGMGYQWPFHGNSFLGFYSYSFLGQGQMWCEYVQSKLLNQLKAGKKYKFSMRINLSSIAGGGLYGVSKIGVNLSNISLFNSTKINSFNLNPTMLNSKGYLEDTVNWMVFEEEFVATGLENYMTIGWFADTVTSDKGYFDTTFNTTFYGAPYYGIDSLNLQELNSDLDIKNFSINIITPNNDGTNDIIDFNKYNLNSLKFDVYNRWGNIVYTSKDLKTIWNGTTNNNNPLNDGVYYYIIEATQNENKEIIKKAGYISLIH